MKSTANPINEPEQTRGQMTPDLKILYRQNREFAKGYDGQNLTMRPRYSTVVLTCMDARVDPSHFLGLDLGDTIVLRNAGGRVTKDVERDLAMLWTMAAQFSNGNAPNLSLAIVHHTECGLEKLANPETQLRTSLKSGLSLRVLKSLAIADHAKSFNYDIQQLRNSVIVPKELIISAHLYNVHSGELQEVILPTRLIEGGILS